MPNIILNRIQTPDGTILTSYHRYDYQCHTQEDGRYYAVDGGTNYLKRVGEDDYTDLSLLDSEPFEVIRENLHWGNTIDKDGNLYEEIKWVPICNLNADHIEAILGGGWGADWIRDLMRKELNYRSKLSKKGISNIKL